jgi:hypothetical protein
MATPAYSVDDNGSARGYPFPEISGAKHRFKSYRLKGEYEKPWLTDPALKKTRWNNIIVSTFVLLGFAAAAAICYITIIPYKQGEVRLPLPHRWVTIASTYTYAYHYSIA